MRLRHVHSLPILVLDGLDHALGILSEILTFGPLLKYTDHRGISAGPLLSVSSGNDANAVSVGEQCQIRMLKYWKGSLTKEQAALQYRLPCAACNAQLDAKAVSATDVTGSESTSYAPLDRETHTEEAEPRITANFTVELLRYLPDIVIPIARMKHGPTVATHIMQHHSSLQ